MESEAILRGFSVALQPLNLALLFLGVLGGTLVGVLPGLGPATAVALLIPLTVDLNPTSALIMMAGIYYGAMYGGSTTSILINTPGEAASVVTTFDGYQMARQGRAGAALAISAIGSFIAGTIGVLMLTLLAKPLAEYAVVFGPTEYFSLMVFALVATSGLSGGSVAKGLVAMIAGLMVSTVGTDLQTGMPRFAMGMAPLLDGIEFIVVVVGLFAITEVIVGYEEYFKGRLERFAVRGRVWITREDWNRSWRPILRGSFLGFFVGALPGAGASIASILEYSLGKRLERHRDEMGKGAIEGVAGPEAANNGASVGSLVPLLTLGIPGSNTTAVMLGALMMYGLRPGPFLFQQNPDLVWGLIDSMYLGNLILLVLNLPLVRIFVKLMDLPTTILLPVIVMVAFAGIYATNQSVLDLWFLVLFGLVGYVMRKADIPTAPLVLSIVLGGPMEQSFRQAMQISSGSPTIFLTHPISATLLAFALASAVLPWLLSRRYRVRLGSDA